MILIKFIFTIILTLIATVILPMAMILGAVCVAMSFVKHSIKVIKDFWKNK